MFRTVTSFHHDLSLQQIIISLKVSQGNQVRTMRAPFSASKISPLVSFVMMAHFLQFSMAAILDAHLQNLLHKMKHKRNQKVTRERSQKRGLRYHHAIGEQNKNAGDGLNIDEAVDQTVYVWIELKGDSATAMNLILHHGGEIRSILPDGIVTAKLSVSSLEMLTQSDDNGNIGRIEAAKPLIKMNDVSNSLHSQAELNTDSSMGIQNNVYWGLNNTRSKTGQGVIIGIIDTGIDWTHRDFIDESGQSRILYYWDQGDLDNDLTPRSNSSEYWEYQYGHEYTTDDFTLALRDFDHAWDRDTNFFAPEKNAFYPIKPSARDIDGHGTHVAGTAAGNGQGSGYVGVAPDAHIIAVKYGFCGDLNYDTFLIDAVQYIFNRARELNMPVVVNLSLGTGLGPHDGTTLTEQSLNNLSGPGRIVVSSAGNSGAMNWAGDLPRGFSKHGSGILGQDDILLRIPDYTISDMGIQDSCEGTYGHFVWFDIWYNASDKCSVQIIAPNGNVYNDPLWSTEGGTAIITTEFGTEISVTNHRPSVNGDNEIFIELEDPSIGTWEIKLIVIDNFISDGTYNAWYAVSDSLVKTYENEPYPRTPTPTFGGSEPDNAMTIYSPAAADHVISVGAYASRLEWNSYNSDGAGSFPMSYTTEPLSAKYTDFRLGDLAFFSGRGPRRDGVTKPDISAPGVGVISSYSHYRRSIDWTTRFDQNGRSQIYLNKVLPDLESCVLEGTSQAAANVAGGIALILEAYPLHDHHSLRHLFKQSSIRDYVTSAFESTSNHYGEEDHVDSDINTSGFSNNDWGYGKLNVFGALSMNLCYSHSDCNDSNDATLDTCDSTKSCIHTLFDVSSQDPSISNDT